MQITRGGFAIVVPKETTTTQDPLLREVRPKLSSHREEPENCHVGSLGNSSATATDPKADQHQSSATRRPPSPKTVASNRSPGGLETAPNVDRLNGVARIVACPRDVAQPGRALRSGRRGRRFKSCHPDSPSKTARRICLRRAVFRSLRPRGTRDGTSSRRTSAAKSFATSCELGSHTSGRGSWRREIGIHWSFPLRPNSSKSPNRPVNPPPCLRSRGCDVNQHDPIRKRPLRIRGTDGACSTRAEHRRSAVGGPAHRLSDDHP